VKISRRTIRPDTGSAERLVVGVTALIAIGASIADATGSFDHVQWLTAHRLDFIILLLGLAAGFLALHASSVDRLHDSVERLTQAQQDALRGTVRMIAGEDEGYSESVSILRRDCKTIFLMQRSATLVLGPEAQLPQERQFFRALLGEIAVGTPFYYVISLEGIREHLLRTARYFSAIPEARAHLEADRWGRTMIRAGRTRVHMKKIRSDLESIKPDKQARMLLVEHKDGTFEGVFTFDIGSVQSCVAVHGTQLSDYMSRALDFYRNDCGYVPLADLDAILSSSEASGPSADS